MRLSRFFKIMMAVTVLALAYIHMQMQIIDLAYQGNDKEQEIKRLIEENGDTTYKILMMKSVNHLGIAMLEHDSDMQFADADGIIQIAATGDLRMESQSGVGPKLAQRTNPLTNILFFGREAEAKTAR